MVVQFDSGKLRQRPARGRKALTQMPKRAVQGQNPIRTLNRTERDSKSSDGRVGVNEPSPARTLP